MSFRKHGSAADQEVQPDGQPGIVREAAEEPVRPLPPLPPKWATADDLALWEENRAADG